MKLFRKGFALLCALSLLLALLPTTALAETMDVRALAIVNKPGVVLVWTTWTADMSLREFSLDEALFSDINAEVTRMIEEGEIANDASAIYSVIIQMIAANMHNYAYYTGAVTKKKVSTWGMGSGSIITPDGYLITNAHVVKGDEKELYQYFAMSNLQAQADTDIAGLLAEIRKNGYEPSKEELIALYDAYFSLLVLSFDLDNLQTSYACVLGNVTPGSDVTVKGISMDLRKIGEPYPGKDIAILKVDGQNNLPTVTLGDDSKMKTGDKVYAMGYPGAATLHDSINLNQSMQEPTLTQGIISARKQMTGGWGILQMDAAIHYGNSGGPLFNEAGEVIGINTFGSIDDNSGTMVGGMNFAVPINLVKQFLNEINVTPSESTFTTNFKKALTAYNTGDFKTALDLLHGINDTNPGFPVVQELLAESRIGYDNNPKPAAAGASTDPSKPAGDQSTTAFNPTEKTASDDKILGMPPFVVYAGAAVIVIAIALVLVLVLRKKKPASAGAPVFAAGAPMPIISAPAPQPVIAAPPSSIHCMNCGLPISASAKFCDGCGQQVIKVQTPTNCPTCDAPLNPGAKFCNECGTKID